MRITLTLIALLLYVTAYAREERTYFTPEELSLASDSTLWLTPLYRGITAADMEVRASTRSPKAHISIVWAYDTVADGTEHSATFSLADLSDNPYTAPVSEVEASLLPQGISGIISDGVGAFGADNTFAVSFDFTRCTIAILTGSSLLKEVITAPIDSVCAGAVRFGLRICGSWDIDMGVASHKPDHALALRSGLTADSIATILDGATAPPAGYWKYLDRNTDPAYTRLGGEYSLAIVPDSTEGNYLILYLAGAATEASAWVPGMIKGRLTATPFQNHFNLVWYDASMRPYASECSATLEQPTVLRLDLPLLKATIRLAADSRDSL